MFVKKVPLATVIADVLKYHAAKRGDSVYSVPKATKHRWAINRIKHTRTLSDYMATLDKEGFNLKETNPKLYAKIHVGYILEIIRNYPELKSQAVEEIREALALGGFRTLSDLQA